MQSQLPSCPITTHLCLYACSFIYFMRRTYLGQTNPNEVLHHGRHHITRKLSRYAQSTIICTNFSQVTMQRSASWNTVKPSAPKKQNFELSSGRGKANTDPQARPNPLPNYSIHPPLEEPPKSAVDLRIVGAVRNGSYMVSTLW